MKGALAAIVLAVSSGAATADNQTILACLQGHAVPEAFQIALQDEGWSLKDTSSLTQTQRDTLTLAYLSTYHYGDATTDKLAETFALEAKSVTALANKADLPTAQTRVYMRETDQGPDMLQTSWLDDGTFFSITCRIASHAVARAGDRPFTQLPPETYQTEGSNSVSRFAINQDAFASVTITPVTISLIAETWHRWTKPAQ